MSELRGDGAFDVRSSRAFVPLLRLVVADVAIRYAAARHLKGNPILAGEPRPPLLQAKPFSAVLKAKLATINETISDLEADFNPKTVGRWRKGEPPRKNGKLRELAEALKAHGVVASAPMLDWELRVAKACQQLRAELEALLGRARVDDLVAGLLDMARLASELMSEETYVVGILQSIMEVPAGVMRERLQLLASHHPTIAPLLESYTDDAETETLRYMIVAALASTSDAQSEARREFLVGHFIAGAQGPGAERFTAELARRQPDAFRSDDVRGLAGAWSDRLRHWLHLLHQFEVVAQGEPEKAAFAEEILERALDLMGEFPALRAKVRTFIDAMPAEQRPTWFNWEDNRLTRDAPVATRVAFASMHHAARRYDDALAAVSGSTAEENFARGRILTDQGRVEEALAAYIAATDQNPALADVWREIGTLLAPHSTDVAGRALALAVTLNPDDQLAQRNLAIVEFAGGAREMARARLQSLVERRPDDGLAWKLLSEVCLVQGDRPAAHSAAREALHRGFRDPFDKLHDASE